MFDLYLLIGLLALATVLLPWINLYRFNQKIEQLHERLNLLEAKLKGTHHTPTRVQSPVKPEHSHTDRSFSPVTTEATSTAKAKQPTSTKHSEYNIAAKLPIWIGAISLIFAAFFLVKYSIEFGYLGPITRVALGGLLGSTLIFIGMRMPDKANGQRIAQGLIGSGITSLYVSLYAAINLYAIIPPTVGFIGMSIITALAILLSLSRGQPIAILGLMGGLLTPALMNANEHNAIIVFSYLFVLFTGAFFVMIRQGWWKLSMLILLSVLGWSNFWLLAFLKPTDAPVLSIFVMAITSVVLLATHQTTAKHKDHPPSFPAYLLNVIAISGGLLTLFWLNTQISLSLFDWSMMGLLSVALITLSYRQPTHYSKLLWLKLAADLMCLLFWTPHTSINHAILVLTGLSVIYIGGSTLLLYQTNQPRLWAGIQTLATFGLYLIAHSISFLPHWQGADLSLFWGSLALGLSVYFIYQGYDLYKRHDDTQLKQQLAMMYSAAVTAFITTGLYIAVPWPILPLAIAFQITLTALVYHNIRLPIFKTIISLLTAFFIMLHFKQIQLFCGIILLSIIGLTPSPFLFSQYITANPLLNLGLPAMLFAIAFVSINDTKHESKSLMHILFATSLMLIVICGYYALRGFMHPDATYALLQAAGFVERGVMTIALMLLGIGIAQFMTSSKRDHLAIWGLGLFYIWPRCAGFILTFFSLIPIGRINKWLEPFLSSMALP